MTNIPPSDDHAVFAELGAMAERLRAESELVLQLREAVETRDVIGQAKGVLMERLKIGESEAFDLLHKESNRTNVKLHDVAAYLTRTGTLENPSN